MKKILTLSILAFSLCVLNLPAQDADPVPANPAPGFLWISGLNHSVAHPCYMSQSTDTLKIAAALAWLPATGGIVDLSCYHKALTITSDIFSTVSKPITFILPTTAVTVNANATIPANFCLKYQAGSSIAAGPTFAITDHSSCPGSPQTVLPYVNHVAGYLILATDKSIAVTGVANATVTLPVVGLFVGQVIRVSNALTGAVNVTVNAVGGPTIGNSVNGTSDVLWSTGNLAAYEWNGSMWWVINH